MIQPFCLVGRMLYGPCPIYGARYVSDLSVLRGEEALIRMYDLASVSWGWE